MAREPNFNVDAATRRRPFDVPPTNLTGSLRDHLYPSEWVKFYRPEAVLTLSLTRREDVGADFTKAMWLHVLGAASASRREKFGDPSCGFFRTPVLVREAPLEVAMCMLAALGRSDDENVALPLARMLDLDVLNSRRKLVPGVYRTTCLRVGRVAPVTDGTMACRGLGSRGGWVQVSKVSEALEVLRTTSEPFPWEV